MNIREGTERRVSFNTKNELWHKIDKLTVAMSRLAAKDNTSRIGQIIGIGDSTLVVGLDKIIETVIYEETLGEMQDKIIEEDIQMIDIIIIIEAGTGQEKGHLQEIIVVAEIEVQVTVDPGQATELIQTEIG